MMSEQGRLVFGVDVMPEGPKRNPMVEAFGRGPVKATCRTCRFVVVRRLARVYHKCIKRGVSSGAATDHRVGWPACAKYEVEGEYAQ